MPVLKLYKDRRINNKTDLGLIEDYLVMMLKTELKAKTNDCQIIWINSEMFKSEFKIYGELLLRKNNERTYNIKESFLTKIGTKLSINFSTNVRLRAFSIKDKTINAVQIKLGESND